MTSVEAEPSCYDPADWQLIKNERNYQASKYQMDLLVGYFELRQYQGKGDLPPSSHLNGTTVPVGGSDDEDEGAEPPIRHLLVHPGVVKTNIAGASLNNAFLEMLAQLTFIIVRVFLVFPTPVIHSSMPLALRFGFLAQRITLSRPTSPQSQRCI